MMFWLWYRVYTTIIVNQDEEYWVREVFDAKKMRKNVMVCLVFI